MSQWRGAQCQRQWQCQHQLQQELQRLWGRALNLEMERELLPPRFRAINPNCAMSYIWTMAVLETGVEWKAEVVCLQEPLTARAGIGISHSAYNIMKRKRVWPAVRNRCGLTTNERTALSPIRGDDVIVVDIIRKGEKMIWVVIMYDQRTRETGDRPERRLNWQKIIKQGGGGTVLTGDFYAYSQRWDPRCTERIEAVYWEGIIDEHGLVIGNQDRPTHHWMRNQSEGKSIIDLTLANQPFGKWTILVGSHATGSDHKIIAWEVEMEKLEEAGGAQVLG